MPSRKDGNRVNEIRHISVILTQPFGFSSVSLAMINKFISLKLSLFITKKKTKQNKAKSIVDFYLKINLSLDTELQKNWQLCRKKIDFFVYLIHKRKIRCILSLLTP